MRILGIDPGIATVGYSVVDCIGNSYKPLEYGVITTPADMIFPERLMKVHRELVEIIRKYEPEDLAIEELFFNKNVKTAIMVAQARGIEVLACANEGLSIYEYTPLQIKQAVTGYGRADKNQVQQMVKTLLNLKEVPKPDDAADALAVAICHGASLKFKDSFLMR